jgi:hypothetical protein
MAHEDFAREQPVENLSDRTFGMVVAGVCCSVAIWPLRHGFAPRWWAFAIAGVFALIALLKPALLARLNGLWTRLGVLLGKVVGAIALGILFYGVIMPVAFLIRFGGKDPLRLKLDPAVDSYWMVRKPPGPPPDSMGNQF